MDETQHPTDPKIEAAMINALMKVLSYPADSEHGTMLVQRIPLICQDIREMKSHVSTMKENIAEMRDNTKWGVRLIIGAVILAGLTLLFK